jgi:hypothetical protein
MTFTDINNKKKTCFFLCFVLYLGVNIYLIKVKKFYQLTREKREFLAMRASVHINSEVSDISSETYSEFNTGLKVLTGTAVCEHY